MILSSIKFKLFKRLLKNVRLSIFSVSSPSRPCSLKEKFLTSQFCHVLYKNELASLSHFVNAPPYSEDLSWFGRLDFIEAVSADKYAVRGWIFSPHYKIKNLFIIVNEITFPVHANNLSRLDVCSKLGFLEHSSYSGFICILEDVGRIDEKTPIKFKIHDYDNTISHGSF